MPPRLRMHHQLRHGEAIFLPRSKIQITDDLSAAAWIATGSQQVRGASMRQLPQNLLADGCHFVEFGCHADEFTYLLLLLCRQNRLPLG